MGIWGNVKKHVKPNKAHWVILLAVLASLDVHYADSVQAKKINLLRSLCLVRLHYRGLAAVSATALTTQFQSQGGHHKPQHHRSTAQHISQHGFALEVLAISTRVVQQAQHGHTGCPVSFLHF